MVSAILAKRARKDLLEIRQYTVNRCGKEQARNYIGQIRHCAEDLAYHLLQGKQCKDIAPHLKSYHVGRQIILRGIQIRHRDSQSFARFDGFSTTSFPIILNLQCWKCGPLLKQIRGDESLAVN